MKFLIQKIKGKVVHDFAFTLIRAAEYHNWLHPNEIKIEHLIAAAASSKEMHAEEAVKP